MKSIWQKDTKRPQFDTLRQDRKTDVLIIGGGMAGILCAHMLKTAGVDCVLLEAEEICSGITKNTTAKITLQHGAIYDKMIKRFGTETARLYLQAQQEALAQYKTMSDTIDCDFETCNAVVYSRTRGEKMEKEAAALNKIGCPAVFTRNLPLPFEVEGAVKVENQARFHPLKFAFSLVKDLPVFEHTKVLELRPDGAICKHGKIKAEKIIVATHFPFLNKHGAYFLKMYQHRSYVLALENAPDLRDMYVDEDKKGLSFREFQGRLLLGGGGHRTGKQGGGWQELRNFAKEHYPHAREIGAWATQDCMTLDDIPYIGPYSKGTESLYVATGFHKWGMASAMVSAMILTDLVQGKENPYAPVFSPSRSMLHPQLVVNALEALAGLLTPTVPRCPHMGCALKYNKQEHSWDCSCHGSRFTEDGKLIDNPAAGDRK